jgi:hypothetical protein
MSQEFSRGPQLSSDARARAGFATSATRVLTPLLLRLHVADFTARFGQLGLKYFAVPFLEVLSLRFLSGSRPGRWVVWVVYRMSNKPLPVPHAAEWMMIPEHSVEQVLETGALSSLYPQDVLEAARRMDRQRREHDEHHAGGS